MHTLSTPPSTQALTLKLLRYVAVLVNDTGTHTLLTLATGPHDLITLNTVWGWFAEQGVTVPGGWAHRDAPNQLTLVRACQTVTPRKRKSATRAAATVTVLAPRPLPPR